MNNSNLVPAKFYFSEFNSLYDGFHDPSRNWNGWAMPMISEKSIKQLIKDLYDPEYMGIFMRQNGDVYIYDMSLDSEPEILSPIEVEGKIYYDFAWLGLCFEVKKSK